MVVIITVTVVVVVVVGTVIGIVGTVPLDYYASRYDHLDVDTILNNRRMVNYYAECLLSRGSCPPQGIEFKRILPEALHTNCLRCTEKQKTVAYRSIKRLRKEYPKIWDQLSALWDPDGSYIEKFEASFQHHQQQPPTPRPTIDNFNEKETTTKLVVVTAAATTAPPPNILVNRFGGDEEESASSEEQSPPRLYPPASSTNSFATTTTIANNLVTATTNKLSSTSTTSTTTTSEPLAIRTRAPTTKPSSVLGAGTNNNNNNFQATVLLLKTIKSIAIQLYQHKMDTLNRILRLQQRPHYHHRNRQQANQIFTLNRF